MFLTTLPDDIAMSFANLAYRALESTNTQTRRLAYITIFISTLSKGSLPEKVLLSRIARWSHENQENLSRYWTQTGYVNSNRRNSAGARYLELARNLGLITPISGEYRLTRVGLALNALKKEHQDTPFVLTNAERLFYMYLLLEKDADVLLTILDRIRSQPDIRLSSLQKTYQQDFIERLNLKGRLVQDERLKKELLDRRMRIELNWKKKARYVEHIVPPRLNWLLDLGLLDTKVFQHHQYHLTDCGVNFIRELPRYENNFYDIDDEWLSSNFWSITPSNLLKIQNLRPWKNLYEEERSKICKNLLREAISVFQYSSVPKISLTQVLFYMTIKMITKNSILVSFSDLKKWLLVPRIIDGWSYHVHLSPQENVSYIVLIPA